MTTSSESVDPILAEIHETRRNLLQQHGGIAGLAAFLRAEEASSGREIVDVSGEVDSDKTVPRGRRPRVPPGRDPSQ